MVLGFGGGGGGGGEGYKEKGAALHLKKKPIFVYLVWLFCTLELCVMDFSTYYTVVNVFNK